MQVRRNQSMRRFSILVAVAATAGAQGCYQFAGPGATLQINITAIVSQTGPTVLSNGGYSTKYITVGTNTLTIGGQTQTSTSTTNTPTCVNCFVGSVLLTGENGLSSATFEAPADDHLPPDQNSWGVYLGGTGILIPSGLLPSPANFPPLSQWLLPGLAQGNGYDEIQIANNGAITYYPITSISPCSATSGGGPGGTGGSGTCEITSVNTAGSPSSAGIAQNTWVEIHGTCLVPGTTPASGVIWNSAPSFLQGQMPTSLNGISVTVNGKAAYIYFYCSASSDPACATDQINVLTPLDPTLGNVEIVATSSGTSTPAFTAAMHTVVPSFLLFSAQGYIAATHLNFSLLGPATLYPGLSTPAAPGETIVAYAVGLGLPTTTLTPGSAIQTGPLQSLPICVIGSYPAVVGFAGLISPGLYQLNITVPASAAAVDNPIVCRYGGSGTPVGDLVSVGS
jgi:uncharacterized protein (TIGR03437 family)